MLFFLSIVCVVSAMPFAKLSVGGFSPPCAITSSCVKSIPIQSNSTNSILMEFRKNPSAFVTAMSKADPATLTEVITLLNSLLTTSNTQEQDIIELLAKAAGELNDANEDVAEADDVLEAANTNAVTANEAVAEAETDLVKKHSARDNAKTRNDDALIDHDGAIDSLNNEQAMLQEVIAILTDLLSRQSGSDPSVDCQAEAGCMLEHNGEAFYKIAVTGTMTSANVLAACQAAGLAAVCDGAAGCGYNDDKCKISSLSSICGMPMYEASQILCGADTYPSNCPEFTDIYNYMFGWSSGSACGTDGSGWCTTGNDNSNKWAWCVTA